MRVRRQHARHHGGLDTTLNQADSVQSPAMVRLSNVNRAAIFDIAILPGSERG